MQYWLVKSEPGAYGWDDLVKEGEATWDGVRNYQARNFLKEMGVGERVLFYHSGKHRKIVGVAKVTQGAYPDPTTDDPRWVAVSMVAEQAFDNPISLATIKADPQLEGILLVKQSRLSVMPIDPAHFNHLIELSREETP